MSPQTFSSLLKVASPKTSLRHAQFALISSDLPPLSGEGQGGPSLGLTNDQALNTKTHTQKKNHTLRSIHFLCVRHLSRLCL